jgi:hypothetical protein
VDTGLADFATRPDFLAEAIGFLARAGAFRAGFDALRAMGFFFAPALAEAFFLIGFFEAFFLEDLAINFCRKP